MIALTTAFLSAMASLAAVALLLVGIVTNKIGYSIAGMALAIIALALAFLGKFIGAFT